MTVTTSPLFSPIKVGNSSLKHRVAMAPLTRFRSPNHVPTDLVTEYYGQRSSRPGTLIITEATYIAAKAGGMPSVPGIWSEEQIEAWSKVFNKIHSNDSFVYVQLWALGRQAFPDNLKEEGPYDYVSASDIPIDAKRGPPRSLTKDEIKEYIQLYVQAAKNSIAAGADGVELHSANGYLPDQFLHENTNHRTDEYGGSIENRARFTLEIIDALVEAIGADKVGIRLSPWNTYGDVEPGVSPIPQWSYVVSELEKRGLNGNRLAFIHIVEPRISGSSDLEVWTGDNEFIRTIWQGILIRAGNMVDVAEQYASDDPKTLAAFGRYFISNPDLVNRLEKKIELNPYDRDTFYTHKSEGYTDYPLSSSSKI